MNDVMGKGNGGEKSQLFTRQSNRVIQIIEQLPTHQHDCDGELSGSSKSLDRLPLFSVHESLSFSRVLFS